MDRMGVVGVTEWIGQRDGVLQSFESFFCFLIVCAFVNGAIPDGQPRNNVCI